MGTPEPPRLRLFVCDTPNLFWSLDDLIMYHPQRRVEFNWSVMMAWLHEELGDNHLAAHVFANVRPGNAHFLGPWVKLLQDDGYIVTLKPQVAMENGKLSDIDDDMLDCIEKYDVNEDVGQIFVLSRDAQNFFVPLRAYAKKHIDVCILGFPGQKTKLNRTSFFRFIDLTQIPGLIEFPELDRY